MNLINPLPKNSSLVILYSRAQQQSATKARYLLRNQIYFKRTIQKWSAKAQGNLGVSSPERSANHQIISTEQLLGWSEAASLFRWMKIRPLSIMKIIQKIVKYFYFSRQLLQDRKVKNQELSQLISFIF